MMWQSLLKAFGIHENSNRLRSELQMLVDAQRDGLQRKSAALVNVLIWSSIAATLFLITAVLAVIAIYITLRENFGPQVAVWSLLAGVFLAAAFAGITAWRSAVAVPALPPITVPEFYRAPESPLPQEQDSTTTASSFAEADPMQTRNGSLDESLKAWMVKTAAQSAASLAPGTVPVDALLKEITPHVGPMAHSVIDEAAGELQSASKGKMALILGTAVLAGVLISRSSR